ncbi:hypothetical protein KCU90_g206, partial [Aureobasidium melanogenum]
MSLVILPLGLGLAGATGISLRALLKEDMFICPGEQWNLSMYTVPKALLAVHGKSVWTRVLRQRETNKEVDDPPASINTTTLEERRTMCTAAGRFWDKVSRSHYTWSSCSLQLVRLLELIVLGLPSQQLQTFTVSDQGPNIVGMLMTARDVSNEAQIFRICLCCLFDKTLLEGKGGVGMTYCRHA